MTDVETSFTVEVLGFPQGADPEALAESVSSFFGISIDEGRRLVQKAPIRVKRNASAEVTRQLVKQLRKLGADVLVRNEQSGEERTYSLANARRPSIDLAPEAVLGESAAEGSAPEDAPQAAGGDDLVEEPEAPPAPASADVAPASADGRPSAPHDAHPHERDSISLPPRESQSGPNAAQRSSSVSLPPPSGSGSLPPPASPILSLPPPAAPKLDFCGACKAAVDKGETCARCGWSNTDKERRCRQCKRKLAIVSAVSRSPAMIAVVVLVALALGAGGLVVLGPPAGAAGVALGVALGLVADAFTLRYACKSCTVAVVSGRLQREEESRLRTARGKSLSLAALGAVVMGGLLAVTGFSGRALSDASYGISWTLPVPRMHRTLGAEVVTIKLPAGNKRVRMSYAERPYLGGPTYFMGHVQYTHPASPVEPDRAGLETSVSQVIEAVFAGTPTGPMEEAGEYVHVSFTGTFHGKPVHGHIRGVQHDHDMLILAVTAGTQADVDSPAARDVLGRVVVQREPQ